MRVSALALLAALLLTPAFAAQQPSSAPQPDERSLVEHGSYINSDGKMVHKPAHSKSGKKPADATAQCADGSYSFSKHHRGTCSGHGGVVEWFK